MGNKQSAAAAEGNPENLLPPAPVNSTSSPNKDFSMGLKKTMTFDDRSTSAFR